MYQVKVYNRQTSEVIMESDTFSTLAEADEMISRVGSGEGYYSVILKLDAVWSDLVTAQSSVPRSPPTRAGGGFICRGTGTNKYDAIRLQKYRAVPVVEQCTTKVCQCVRTNEIVFCSVDHASYT